MVVEILLNVFSEGVFVLTFRHGPELFLFAFQAQQQGLRWGVQRGVALQQCGDRGWQGVVDPISQLSIKQAFASHGTQAIEVGGVQAKAVTA
ncbi:hypothetical protein D3C78_1541910 [compost metagenome]